MTTETTQISYVLYASHNRQLTVVDNTAEAAWLLLPGKKDQQVFIAGEGNALMGKTALKAISNTLKHEVHNDCKPGYHPLRAGKVDLPEGFTRLAASTVYRFARKNKAGNWEVVEKNGKETVTPAEPSQALYHDVVDAILEGHAVLANVAIFRRNGVNALLDYYLANWDLPDDEAAEQALEHKMDAIRREKYTASVYREIRKAASVEGTEINSFLGENGAAPVQPALVFPVYDGSKLTGETVDILDLDPTLYVRFMVKEGREFVRAGWNGPLYNLSDNTLKLFKTWIASNRTYAIRIEK